MAGTDFPAKVIHAAMVATTAAGDIIEKLSEFLTMPDLEPGNFRGTLHDAKLEDVRIFPRCQTTGHRTFKTSNVGLGAKH
jgi:hypothetical protein